jgi:DNA-binding CsgD family transcriptional regulator
VGRDEELAALHAAVAGVAAGRGGTAWLEGEPGIGKSTLVAAVLAEAQARRCQVYRAAGDELGQRLPLRALTDALGPWLAADAGVLLDAVGGDDQIGHESAVPAAVERFLATVDRLCADRPVVFVLDDLQWADEASLLAWYRLALAVEQIPLLLVGATRPVPVRPSVRRLRRDVVERDGLLLPLAPLSRGDTIALLGRLAGGEPGERLRRTAARTGGNPLYTRELVDALRREGRLRAEGGGIELVGTAGPIALGAAIRNRLDFLSPDAAATLRVAALLGPEFSPSDLATVTGRAGSALRPMLAEAVAAGVLAESAGRLAFRHDLIRHALYEAVPASARAALHRQVAQVLADAGLPLGQVGAHLLAAAPDALDGWALDWLAGHARGLAQVAPDLAAELLPVAGDRADPSHPHRAALLHGLATALGILNRRDEAATAARQAIAATRDPARSAELVWDLANFLYADGRYADCSAAVDGALDTAGTDARWRARLLAMRARVLAITSPREECDQVARQALAEGEQLGDPVAQAQALGVLYLISDLAGGRAYLDRALAVIGHRPDTADLRLGLLANSAYNFHALGDFEAAERQGQEALILAEQMGSRRVASIRALAGELYVESGRWDEALAVLEPTSEKVDLIERLVRWGALAFIAAHRDDRARCAQLLTDMTDLPELAGFMRGNASFLYMARAVDAEQRGGPAAGLAVLAGTLAIEDGTDLFGRCLWLPDVARLALTADRPDLAQAAVAAADADAQADALPRRVTAARHTRALLDGDAAALLAAADQYGTLNAPLGVGQCHEEAALLLARAGDVTGARSALTRAATTYADLGARWDIRRADARLREHGVRRGQRTAHRRATTGWEALTQTEERVAALVAQGRSNPDIAAELLVSRRTVQTHVSNILTKLGYASRVEITREANRRLVLRPGD